MPNAAAERRAAVRRRCAACRAVKPRGGLIRVVRRAGGSVELAGAGHADGRSAYVCREAGCIALAAGPRSPLQRALRAPVPAEVLTALQAEEIA